MGQIQKVFNRYEKKFLLDEKTYESFKRELDEYMEEDEYGLHTIRNIYYDTPTDELIRTSIEGPKYKEKFRVRCYGKPTYDSMCFLEIKKKYKGLVNKRRVAIPMEEAEQYLIDGKLPSHPNQIFKEIDYFFNHYNTPYVGPLQMKARMKNSAVIKAINRTDLTLMVSSWSKVLLHCGCLSSLAGIFRNLLVLCMLRFFPQVQPLLFPMRLDLTRSLGGRHRLLLPVV